MKEILTSLIEKNILSKQQAKDILTAITSGQYSDVEVASFITVFLMRPIEAEELAGFREALLDLCVRVDFSEYNTIDVCGTGGDGKDTFNISTLSAFVLAGAGVKVAKHGNYSASSACGSSNVLEYYGYQFSTDKDKLKRELDKSGICYLHAPLFHPALKNVGPVRRALKLKTFFNMLGPMVNPSFPQNQLVGVYSPEVMKLYDGVFKETGSNYTILHSRDGYDEISLTGDFSYISQAGNGILSPVDFGFQNIKEQDLLGGKTVEASAAIFLQILEGKGTEAQHHVVIANAAVGLKTVDPLKELPACVEEAKASLLGGKALGSFKKLIGQNGFKTK